MDLFLGQNPPVMPEITTRLGEQALKGEWERIGAKCFEMQEDMVFTFEGVSCNIADSENNLIPGGKLGSSDGEVTRNVLAGYRCYVMRARVKFEKKTKWSLMRNGFSLLYTDRLYLAFQALRVLRVIKSEGYRILRKFCHSFAAWIPLKAIHPFSLNESIKSALDWLVDALRSIISYWHGSGSNSPWCLWLDWQLNSSRQSSTKQDKPFWT